MLNSLRVNGFDCLLTLISIKMQHPNTLQVCTNVCIIFSHTGAGVIRVGTIEYKKCTGNYCTTICCKKGVLNSRKSLQIETFRKIIQDVKGTLSRDFRIFFV